MNRIRTLLFVIFLLLVLVACTPAETPSSEMAVGTENVPAGTIVVGDVSNDRAETIEQLQPTADYLASQLHDHGIGVGEVRVAPDLETMIEWMNNGEIDIYFDSSYPTMLILSNTEMEPVLRQWRQGIGEYQSVIFSQDNITSLEQLQGGIIAFEVPYSSSGFMLPFIFISNEGYSLKQIETFDDRIDDDEIGYIFTGSDHNNIESVINGKVLAAAIDSPTYEQDIPAETKDRFSELGRSVFVPRQIVSLHPDLDPAVKDTIADVLKEMENSEEGLLAMEQTGTTRFDEFPDGVDETVSFLTDLFLQLYFP